MSTPRFSAIALLFLALSTSARAVRAQTQAELAAADASFNDALALMDAGKFAEACPKLEYSQALAPASGTLLNLADCYEQLGHAAKAWSTFSKAAELARVTNKPDREQVALGRAAALAPRIVQLIVTPPQSPTPGLEITIDGSKLPETEWRVPVALEPGPHTVGAMAPGRQAFRADLSTLSAGSSVPVRIPELAPIEPMVTQPVLEPAAPTRVDGQAVAAIASATVGVAGLVAGTAFGLQSKSKHDESDRYCEGNVCQEQRGVDLMDEARRAGNRATVSFVIGGVGLGVAGVLWFVRPFGKKQETAVRIGFGPGAVRVAGSW
jgi:hypothetical protein